MNANKKEQEQEKKELESVKEQEIKQLSDEALDEVSGGAGKENRAKPSRRNFF